MNTRAVGHTGILENKVVSCRSSKMYLPIMNFPISNSLSCFWKCHWALSHRAQQQILHVVVLPQTLGQGTLFLPFLLICILRSPWHRSSYCPWTMALLAANQPRRQILPLTLHDAAKFRPQYLTKLYYGFSYASYLVES